MRNRWTAAWVRWCRHLAPDHLRDAAFDPSVSDLVLTSTPRVRFCLQVLLIALECRRLGAARAITPAVAPVWIPRSLVTQHLRIVFRRLWREPRFTAAVVLTLALGLGANLTVFTFVDAFLIAKLPVPHPEALVRVGQARENGEVDITSYLNFRDGRDATRDVMDLAAHAETVALMGPADNAEPRPLEVVSGNYFRALGVMPQRGRLFDEGDEPGELAHPVAVVSDQFWKTRLGQRADVIGQPLYLNGARFEIVGVAPADFPGTYASRHIDIWAPVSMQQIVRPRGLTLERRTWGWLSMIGRLRAGATQLDADRALARAADDINTRFPPRGGDAPLAFITRPASAMADADARMLEAPLMTAYMFTGLLFLATCANLAGLLHTRLAARSRDLMIRESLGAGRVRLLVEWMTECLVLALCGGAAALLVARLTAVGLARIELPMQMMGAVSFHTTLQWRVVGYALLLSVSAGVLFGLASGWRRRIVVSGPARTRRSLVAIQVGISVVLLVVASLLTSSLHRQQVAAPGFNAGSLGVLSLDLRRQRVPENEWPALTERLVDVARAVPGVTRADIGFRAPLEPGEDQIIVRVPGYDPAHDAEGLTVDFNQVGPTYFETLGVPFIRGGPWAPRTTSASVVINQTMAERYWPTRDAVGQTVLIGQAPAVVAGVVADTVYYNVGEAPRPYIYLPSRIQPPGAFVLHVAASAGTDVSALIKSVGRSLVQADSRLVPFDVMSFDELRRVPLMPIRLLASAAVVFGGVSLLLTVVGLFGVIAASVTARTREIGVRLALGAAPDRIQRGVIGEALVLAAAGGTIGLAAAWFTARELRVWLFDVQPFEPVVSLAVVLLVSVVAAMSAWIPARRASRVDPIIVLK